MGYSEFRKPPYGLSEGLGIVARKKPIPQQPRRPLPSPRLCLNPTPYTVNPKPHHEPLKDPGASVALFAFFWGPNFSKRWGGQEHATGPERFQLYAMIVTHLSYYGSIFLYHHILLCYSIILFRQGYSHYIITTELGVRVGLPASLSQEGAEELVPWLTGLRVKGFRGLRV